VAARNERLQLSVRLVEILIEERHPLAVARIEMEKFGEVVGAVCQVLAFVELGAGDELVELRRSLAQLNRSLRLDVLRLGGWLGEGALSFQKCVQPRPAGLFRGSRAVC